MALLRGAPAPDDPFYRTLVAAARAPHWYRDGGVPDTVEGRFAMLTAVLALAIARAERDGSRDGLQLGVRLTETFVADMEAQLRQDGHGDTGVGKRVRAMVGMLGAKVGALGAAEPDAATQGRVAADGLKLGQRAVNEPALVGLAARLGETPLADLEQGAPLA